MEPTATQEKLVPLCRLALSAEILVVQGIADPKERLTNYQFMRILQFKLGYSQAIRLQIPTSIHGSETAFRDRYYSNTNPHVDICIYQEESNV